MYNKQLLLAHRGFSGISPENTLKAFQAASLFEFDGVELDVHLTKDKEIVIIHDETTTRTSLVEKEVEFSTVKELKELDFGAFYKYKFQKQEIMTLEEFLDQFLDQFKVINIEIKTDEREYKGIEEKIHQLAQKYGTKLIDKVIFSSFNFNSLEKMYQLNPRYQLAFLFWKQNEFKKISIDKIKRICKYLNPWTVLYDKYKEEYKKLNIPFILWTLKDKKKYLEYLEDKDVVAQISNYKF